MSMRLGGWERLGIVLTVLWLIAVGMYTLYELQAGPGSPMLLIEMVVSKTGEPVSSLAGNPFLDLVPVEARVRLYRLVTASIVPPLLLFVTLTLGIRSVKWVIAGFRQAAPNSSLKRTDQSLRD